MGNEGAGTIHFGPSLKSVTKGHIDDENGCISRFQSSTKAEMIFQSLCYSGLTWAPSLLYFIYLFLFAVLIMVKPTRAP